MKASLSFPTAQRLNSPISRFLMETFRVVSTPDNNNEAFTVDVFQLFGLYLFHNDFF